MHGNGAVAHVMTQVCGGVIGYPITPSTEIAELFEAARAEGALNVWGRHPFFVEAEGEHSAQSGALGAALTGGHFVSNASSSQGVLYAMESHVVTVGKKIGGFVLQVAARVVSRHSLNVMAGHDDVYALLPAGYTILFGSDPQEAADLAAIAYRTSSLSLVPVANAMDGFATSHVMSEVRLPEPELLKEYLGDPAGRIPAPTVAQEVLLGARGRVFQLERFLDRHADDVPPADLAALRGHLAAAAEAVEADDDGAMADDTGRWLPEELRAPWRRQWRGAWRKGTRQLVPALVDVHDPGVTGPVQNQPDFQAGAVDHRTHFASEVPRLVRQAMAEYTALTGRTYAPVRTYGADDADLAVVGMGSVTDDVRAVLPYLEAQGLRVRVVSVKLLQPFPEDDVVDALRGATAVTVLERSEDTALTRLVTQALFRAHLSPRLTTAIFGLGGHDLQPRHTIAMVHRMAEGATAPLVYLGSQLFAADPPPHVAELQDRLRAAYPETEAMALATEPNPPLLPPSALRVRFHSVGGYGTVATGKLLTQLLAGLLGMHPKAAPKYGSEKSGAPTSFSITLSPEPVLLTNAELEDVEVVVSPDHKAFVHTNPLKGLVPGGTFLLQSDLSPLAVWRDLPAYARRTIRERRIRFLVVDAFAVATRHAPTPELETRMMGMAFIGAVVGHVDRVSGGASPETVLERVRERIVAKFGAKGDAVVEANMAVIRDGAAATVPVEYDDPAFLAVESEPARPRARTAALSASMCPTVADPRPSALFDPGYFDDVVGRPFREGTIGEAPVLPGTGIFMPVGTGAARDKGVFRRTVPVFDPTSCTGCLECALVCPDVAIPNTVHEVHDLLLTAIAHVEATGPQRDALCAQVPTWSARVRELYRADRTERPFADVVADAASVLDAPSPTTARLVGAVVHEVAAYPVARTRPFFDAPERTTPGTGGLFAATVDPWKCTGCLQCVEVCGPGALGAQDQTPDLLTMLEDRFETMTHLPNTPRRFLDGATTADGDLKRVVLDHTCYYATTGGHGACRGCGEVTAIRLVTSLSRALGDQRRVARTHELTGLLTRLADKRDALADDDARRAHIAAVAAELDRRLYLDEGGPTGHGPAPTVVANSTGCSSVYASTMPFTPYLDPWVNSLFQDAQPLAAGLFEGIAAHVVPEVRALREARLELDDAYDPAVHGPALRALSWRDFTDDELGLLPTVLTVGGDGASYDIGFGAMSRVLTGGTPVKMLVLDTGAYSNTGGQASTASFTGQDADLARVGRAHLGKAERRKELALLAALHPDVFACVTATALHGHFLRTALRMIEHPGPAVMDVHTPCGTENGVAEDQSHARSRLAVESRMSPVLVHDPRQGETLAERLSLDGNPDVDSTWTTTTLAYLDDAGAPQVLTTTLTPAHFALGEGRFRKQFRPLRADEADAAVPVEEYVELTAEAREGRVPVVLATDAERHLLRVACSPQVVALVEDRRRHWHLLQHLAGRHVVALTARHREEVDALTARYEEAARLRETSLDDIARVMADLAVASGAPAVVPGVVAGAVPGVVPAAPRPGPLGASDGPVAPKSPVAVDEAPIRLDPADEALCNDCGTCYQELPQLFERVTAVVDGEVRSVARMRPGALEHLEVTPDVARRIARVKATCDAEIIR
ncbi:2-oxoacid:acceptor oxidoreductase family protein [Actinotalea sp. AC32]|nr:2-oxoacid:acceptor oxidoreductase family protein [Actinotalea sp. AC32]